MAAFQLPEATLHGEYLPIQSLWNELETSFRPIEEEEFSDYIARHLNDDLKERGVIVNREVVIKRKQGDGVPGQRTDIKVDAISKSETTDYDVVTAIIEVKGCWNPKLDEAMESQLAARYLTENHCKHGLYVIGWFNCKQWKDDPRLKTTPQINLETARSKFREQAVRLCSGGREIESLVLDTALR